MIRLSLTLLVPLLILGCKGAGGGGSTTGSSCSTTTLESEMTSLLSSATSEVDFTYIAERSDGRRFTYNRGASTPTTSYESASTSKMVTAAVILKLVQDGYLNLSDKPQDRITGWTIGGADSLYNMTLAHLLSFRSGLEDEPACLNFGASDFETCAKNAGTANAGNGVVPGQEFYYSGSHMQVAGLMAAKVRNKTWAQIFSDFKTATGLFASSSYDLPSSTNPRLGGGMHWTANDYMAFLKALKNGQILNSTYLSQMLTDQTASATFTYSPVSAIGEAWHYGFGLWHECQSATYNCTPGTRVSSPGAYGAYPFWDRTYNYFGIVARQGALGTYPNGIAIERTVRSKAETWAGCLQ